MEKSEFSPEVKQQVTKFFKVIGDQTRFSILYLLKGRELNVTEIAQALDMEQSAISHQLQVLRESKLLKSRRDKRSVYYSQADDHVYEIISQAIEHMCEE